MKNKYYTPSIEEFHVGFEYEVKTLKMIDMATIPKGVSLDDHIKSLNLVDEWEITTWNEISSYDHEFNAEYYDAGSKVRITIPDSIRVKYLDREDIESLGFIYTGESYFKTVDNVEIQIEPHAWFKVDGITTHTIRYLDPNNDEGKVAIEFAIIKNKSELKRLLKQLNIEG